MDKFREAQMSEVLDGLKGDKKNLAINTIFDLEPVNLLKERSDAIY